MLVRVVAPHFVAGLVLEGGRCIRAAPILRWTVGLEAEDLRQELRRRAWRASIVGEEKVIEYRWQCGFEAAKAGAHPPDSDDPLEC